MLRNKKQGIGLWVAGIALVAISLMMFAPVYATGTFTQAVGTNLPNLYNSGMDWGDYDNDGDLDVLLAGASEQQGIIAQIWNNNGNGTFTQNTAVNLYGTEYPSLEWGDYDNDGDLDFILAGISGVVQIWTNDGAGNFSPLSQNNFPEVWGDIKWGDYDNDGDLDFAVSGVDPSMGYVLYIWNYNENDIFELAATIPNFSGSLEWGDYDKDTDLDLLISGTVDSHTDVTQIWRNEGGLFVQLQGTTITGITGGRSSWVDYNNDTQLDIFLSGSSSTGNVSQIWKNEGNGVFNLIPTGITGVYNSAHDWGDYDNDGDLDLLLTGLNNNLHIISDIWINNRDDTFAKLTVALIGVHSGDVEWVDLDNDGDLDFLLSGNGSASGNLPITQVWANGLNQSRLPVELLRNRSFEADSDPVDGLADYWGIIGGTSERRLCDLSGAIGRTGPCAFEFRGSATEDSRIQQRIPISSATFNAGDTLTLRGFVRAGGEPNFRLRIIVDYADGTADVGQVRVNTVSTAYVAFPDLALTLTKSDPIQVRVWVWSRSLSGRTYFDDLSLILSKPAAQGLIPMP